jgi:hypothetical protein
VTTTTSRKVNLFYVLRNGGHACKYTPIATLHIELQKLMRRGLEATARDPETHEVVGEVFPHPDTGHLSWWCEDDE